VALSADATRIEQVLANLLVNAAKYTNIGGRIALRARRDEDEVSIAVSDDGIGLDPAMKDQIFDLFVQAAGGSRGARAGLGVGLTLVKRLVELHGGRVEAFSDGPGRGSEFRVHLPLPARESAAPKTDPPRPASAPVSSGSGRRILVVDDNVEAAEGLAELLRHMGHDVRVRHGGAGALEDALRSAPEFVFLDIGMPDVDGHEVARRLRSEPGTQGCVLVALTGFGQESDRRASREAGFDHHLVKPIDVAAVEALLRPSPPVFETMGL
jgi:two-component system CheB/CheR fusion protein